MFTWRRKWELPKDLLLDGKKIDLSQSTKFLGIHLDTKLNFNEHIKYITKKSDNVPYAMQKGCLTDMGTSS